MNKKNAIMYILAGVGVGAVIFVMVATPKFELQQKPFTKDDAPKASSLAAKPEKPEYHFDQALGNGIYVDSSQTPEAYAAAKTNQGFNNYSGLANSWLYRTYGQTKNRLTDTGKIVGIGTGHKVYLDEYGNEVMISGTNVVPLSTVPSVNDIGWFLRTENSTERMILFGSKKQFENAKQKYENGKNGVRANTIRINGFLLDMSVMPDGETSFWLPMKALYYAGVRISHEDGYFRFSMDNFEVDVPIGGKTWIYSANIIEQYRIWEDEFPEIKYTGEGNYFVHSDVLQRVFGWDVQSVNGGVDIVSHPEDLTDRFVYGPEYQSGILYSSEWDKD